MYIYWADGSVMFSCVNDIYIYIYAPHLRPLLVR